MNYSRALAKADAKARVAADLWTALAARRAEDDPAADTFRQAALLATTAADLIRTAYDPPAQSSLLRQAADAINHQPKPAPRSQP